MIISHKHKYLFIQLEKTASTAIAQELCEHYDGQEILWKHARYEDFLAVATPEEKKYFVFAGVRNPLDIVVSRYHLRMLGRGNKMDKNNLKQHLFLRYNDNFEKFFLKFYGYEIYEDWKTLRYDRLDFIYRYENLQQDFSNILKKLNLDQLRPLPWTNKTPNKIDYLTYYDSAKVQIRARLVFGPYAKKWGYRFSELWPKLGMYDILILRSYFYFKYFFKKAVHGLIDSPAIYRYRLIQHTNNVLSIKKKN